MTWAKETARYKLKIQRLCAGTNYEEAFLSALASDSADRYKRSSPHTPDSPWTKSSPEDQHARWWAHVQSCRQLGRQQEWGGGLDCLSPSRTASAQHLHCPVRACVQPQVEDQTSTPENTRVKLQFLNSSTTPTLSRASIRSARPKCCCTKRSPFSMSTTFTISNQNQHFAIWFTWTMSLYMSPRSLSSTPSSMPSAIVALSLPWHSFASLTLTRLYSKLACTWSKVFLLLYAGTVKIHSDLYCENL